MDTAAVEDDEPFDVFKQRTRRPQTLKRVRSRPVVGSPPMNREQIPKDSSRKPGQQRLLMSSDRPSSQLTMTQDKSTRGGKHERRGPQNKKDRRRFSRFNLRRDEDMTHEDARNSESQVMQTGPKRRRLDPKRFTFLQIHSDFNSDDHECSVEPRTVSPSNQRDFIPISKLLLSPKDQAFLRSLAPVAFFRQEKYNWGHVRVTNFRLKQPFPSLIMSSQAASFPQEDAKRFNDHKSISNPSAQKETDVIARPNQRVSHHENPSEITEKPHRQRGKKSVVNNQTSGSVLRKTFTKRYKKKHPFLLKTPKEVRRVKWACTPKFKGKRVGRPTQVKLDCDVIPSARPSDQILAPCTPSPAQDTLSTGLADGGKIDDYGSIKGPLRKDGRQDVLNRFPIAEADHAFDNVLPREDMINQDHQSHQHNLRNHVLHQSHQNSTHITSLISIDSDVETRESRASQPNPLTPDSQALGVSVNNQKEDNTAFKALVHHLSDISNIRHLFPSSKKIGGSARDSMDGTMEAHVPAVTMNLARQVDIDSQRHTFPSLGFEEDVDPRIQVLAGAEETHNRPITLNCADDDSNRRNFDQTKHSAAHDGAAQDEPIAVQAGVEMSSQISAPGDAMSIVVDQEPILYRTGKPAAKGPAVMSPLAIETKKRVLVPDTPSTSQQAKSSVVTLATETGRVLVPDTPPIQDVSPENPDSEPQDYFSLHHHHQRVENVGVKRIDDFLSMSSAHSPHEYAMSDKSIDEIIIPLSSGGSELKTGHDEQEDDFMVEGVRDPLDLSDGRLFSVSKTQSVGLKKIISSGNDTSLDFSEGAHPHPFLGRRERPKGFGSSCTEKKRHKVFLHCANRSSIRSLGTVPSYFAAQHY